MLVLGTPLSESNLHKINKITYFLTKYSYILILNRKKINSSSIGGIILMQSVAIIKQVWEDYTSNINVYIRNSGAKLFTFLMYQKNVPKQKTSERDHLKGQNEEKIIN